jgi:hypothetical protein
MKKNTHNFLPKYLLSLCLWIAACGVVFVATAAKAKKPNPLLDEPAATTATSPDVTPAPANAATTATPPPAAVTYDAKQLVEMRKQAQRLEKAGNNLEAYDIYSVILQQSRKMESMMDMVRVLVALDNMSEAAPICRELLYEKDPPFIVHGHWGQIQFGLRNYAEAFRAVELYESKGGKDPAILKIKPQAKKMAAIAETGIQYVVRNEKKLNTDFNDFAPSMFGNILLFSSNRPYAISEQMSPTKAQFFTYDDDIPPGMFMSEYDKREPSHLSNKEMLALMKSQQDDILVATERVQNNDGTANSVNLFMSTIDKYPNWTQPEATPISLNLYQNNGPAIFAANGNTLYVSYVDNEGKKTLKTTHKLRDKKEWTYPMEVKFSKDWNKVNICSQCVSADGSVLIISAEGARQSEGGYDLYMCRLGADGLWGEPINLGRTVNTKGDEMFPSFDADGRLYFSSTGHGGLGGADIFRTNGAINNWTTVENLAPPINSTKDDYNIMFYPGSSTSGLFVSNRPGGMGNDDIYSFDKIQGAMDKTAGLIAIKVINQDTKAPIPDATITLLTDKGDNYTATTAINGQVFFAVPPNQKYALSAIVKDDLYARQTKLPGNQIQAGRTLEQTVLMKQIKFTPEKKKTVKKGKPAAKKNAKGGKKKTSTAKKSKDAKGETRTEKLSSTVYGY